jgi:hypothetical protein
LRREAKRVPDSTNGTPESAGQIEETERETRWGTFQSKGVHSLYKDLQADKLHKHATGRPATKQR